MICFSSVFDIEGVDFLERMNVPAYKIASFEIHHRPLINKVLNTGKPLIVSVGMASFDDFVWFSQRLPKINTVLLKCVSSYPAHPSQFNLKTIESMKREFGFDIGLSDHTKGLGVSLASIGNGAVMIERHFTLKREGKSPDDPYSLEPHEMEQLVRESKDAWEAQGTDDWGVYGEQQHKRSLYASRDIKKGEKFSYGNVWIYRPNSGIDPKEFFRFERGRASEDIKKGTPLHYRHIA